MSNISNVIWSVYEPRIREQFKYHPNGDYIVDQMKSGELTAEEINSAFGAAEAYMAQETFQNISQDKPVIFFGCYGQEPGA